MFNVDNILLATDLSEHCGAAAQWTEQFRRATSGRVIVEHVIELSVSSWLTSAFETLEDEASKKEAEEKVAAWYAEHAEARPDDVLLRAGSCFGQISETVESLPGETVLVISMSGRGAVSRLLVGSTAHQLASQPPCPLVIVHPERHDLLPDAPIVTGTDLSHNGAHVVDVASSLARTLKRKLHVLHGYGAPNTPLVQFESDVDERTAQKKLEHELESTASLQGVDYSVHVRDDEPGEFIVEHAQTAATDLIVVGHSGESPVVQSVLGSVAQRVLKNMPCTLFLVPPIPSADA